MLKAEELLFEKIKTDHSFEGLRLSAYRCEAGVLTIGYGHTGTDVYEGQCISAQYAEALLRQDIGKCLNKAIQLSPILQKVEPEKLEAIMDFIFNLGSGAYAGSTLRRKVNASAWAAAEQEINRWTHIRKNGKLIELKGLVLRREWEGNLLYPD